MAQSLADFVCASLARTSSRPQSDADDPAYSASFCCTPSRGFETLGVEDSGDADGAADLLQALTAATDRTSRIRGSFMANDCKSWHAMCAAECPKCKEYVPLGEGGCLRVSCG